MKKEQNTNNAEIQNSTNTDIQLFDLIKTEEDVDLFVRTVDTLRTEKLMQKTDDYVDALPKPVLQLLWLVTVWLINNTKYSERTIDTMKKILQACNPLNKRKDQAPFDFLAEDSQQESFKEKYEYFKYGTFGVQSNCYQKTVQSCNQVLEELSLVQVIEALQIAKNNQSEEEKSLWGNIIQKTGQDLQVALYEKYLTAIHEASHAVAYYLLNMSFHGVTIVSADGYGGKLFSECSRQYEFNKRAIALYAGEMGERAILNPVFPRVCVNGGDVEIATTIIKEEIIKELSDPREALKYIFVDADVLGLADKESPYIAYKTIERCIELREQAFNLITANKDMVEALANELLEKNSMPSEEVVAFLDAWKDKNKKEHE